MLGAMWEGWKGRSIEMDKLAAENVALKKSKPSLKAMMSALDAFYADEDVPESAMLIAFNILRGDIETPATDAYLAGIKADGVDIIRNALIKFVEDEVGPNDVVPGLIRGAKICVSVADSLREGADK